jgi:hypothetical protein
MDYNSKVKIYNKIKKINDTHIFQEIFDIAKDELFVNNKKKFSHNSNGIYFDLLLLSDNTINKIDDIVSSYITETETETFSGFNLPEYSAENKVEKIQGSKNGPRLSNQEKNIMMKMDE